ncbi:DUF2635 domain-containing protein [Pseudomonas japonica]|uniref:DUF2635 domain-containing protein n=1 Tax=Pseudomonas japonica TaxID=256466 RepID=UPI003A8A3851
MTTVHLCPAPGRACPMPEKGGELLPAKGAPVPLNAYWQRRINDGDALKQDPGTADEAPAGPAPTADAPADPAPATTPKPARRPKA